MSRLGIFWVLQLIFFLLFFGELGVVASVWLRGRVPGLPPDSSRLRKLWAILRASLGVVFSRRLTSLLGALLLDGILHRRLVRDYPFRWLAHIAAFGGFFLLGLLSVVTGLAAEILIPLGLRNAFTLTLAVPDHPVTALLNEALGLVVVLGVALLIYRRYLQRDAQLRSLGEDGLAVSLIALIVLSGYPLESFRLLAEGVHLREAVWGPLGAGLAWLIRPLDLPWGALHYSFFFVHVLLCDFLLLYLPFSKFFHVLMAPLVLAINSLEEVE